jgi:hypothetical protein
VVAANAGGLPSCWAAAGRTAGQPGRQLLATPEDLAWWDELAAAPHRRPRCGPTPCCAAPTAGCAWCRTLDRAAGRDGEPAGHTAGDAARPQRRTARRPTSTTPRWPSCAPRWKSTADGILVTDLAGRIRSFNRRFAQMWGMPETCSTAATTPGARLDAPQRGRPEAYQRRLSAIQDAALLSSTEQIRCTPARCSNA